MKKKKKIFKDININIEYKPKKSLEIKTVLKNVLVNNIITFPNISYIILGKNNEEQNSSSFFFYNKTNFELTQTIKSISFNHCHILDENNIILSNKDLSEIWQKNESNKFFKYRSLDTSINSNILFDSKSSLMFHHYYDYMKSKIEIWETENKSPKSMVKKFDTNYSYEKKIFFMNNEKVLVLYHCPFTWGKHFQDISISFYDIGGMKNIKNIELENNYCDLKPIKIDENRILIIEKISDDNSFDQNIEENIIIMKVPEFEVVKEFEPDFPVTDVVIYKKYFIFYETMIKIYNIDNYELFKEINIQGIYCLIHLNDNFLIGLINQYNNIKSDFYEEKNQIKDLIIYEANF